ncbi:hypothetical protein F4677DRAFT_463145 [Hypoxylon crocopeplum]|nr:hypothetical protein F4677DRAFT_463145 [Hypoxylon crocopeplum]
MPLEDSGSSAHTRRFKRNRTRYEGDGNANPPKRQLCLPVTPSSVSPQTLRATKSSIASSSVSLSKIEENTFGYYDATQGQINGSQHPVGQTTIDQLTPYPTRQPRKPRSELHGDADQPAVSADFNASNDASLQNSADGGLEFAGKPIAPEILCGDTDTGLKDEYPLDDDLMEEDMASLLDTTLNNVQDRRPNMTQL